MQPAQLQSVFNPGAQTIINMSTASQTPRQARRLERRESRSGVALLQHSAAVPVNPWPPVALLAADQLQALHAASMRILREVGLRFLDAEALQLWQEAGARVDHAGSHVWIEEELLQQLLATAPQEFVWRARNPQRSLRVGGNSIAFGPSGGMVYVTDLERGRRVGDSADYENLLRLTHMLPMLHFGNWEQVTAQDEPVSTRHLRRLYAGFTLSDKAMLEGAQGRIITADAVEMARIAFGGTLPAEPVIGDVINVNSPLTYDDRMLGGLITYARAGQVCIITPFILAGAMSPISIAAALAQQNAEALAGIALTQLVRPGAPVVYGGFTTNTDMRSGSPAFGTPEGAWALLAGAQLARHYRLPYRGSGSLTSSKLADAQGATETMWNLWPCVLGHANLVMHAAGWLEGGLTVSFEKLMIDAEQLAMFAHFLRGFPIDDSSLALESIAAVGPGGHHFGTAHTQARFDSEFFATALADRSGYDSWLAGGGHDTAQRAHGMWRQLLAQYSEPPMDPALREELRAYVARRSIELRDVQLFY